MGSFGKGMLDTEIEITQVSFGGFNKDISAKELTDFLEDECGIIWRCRLKNSWTPPDSFPNFDVDTAANIIVENDYDKVEPHAFVHFASAEATKRAVNASGRCKLLLRGKSLTVNLGPENLFRTNQKRTEIIPFKFYDVRVEIGSLVSRDEFLFGWKGPTSGVNFLIDPFDHSCKILFTKEIAFTFKGTNTHAVLKCNFKMEFSVRDITELKQYRDISSLILLLRLASSPQISYRTADDDIYDSVPFDLLDDEDPWIRTTDFTPGGVIGRCSAYKISISPRFGLKLEKAVNYLKELRIPNPDVPRQKLIVREEPDFRASMSDHFSCIQYKEGINFEILFLVNAVIQKGIFNEHQLSDMFFDLLRNQTKEVSAAALRHIFSLEDPVFDAYEKLKLVQEWLIKNPKLLKSFKGSDDNVEVRRLTITPTKAYCLPPVVELGNRVLRKFREYRDRFLRVTFMDEGLEQLNNNVLTYYVAPIVREITDNSFAQKTGVFKRVKSILVEGFYVCGRKYSFLIFSSGQLRDRSAWFFAEDKKLSVIDIRKWMGKFSDRNVAKCTARMGLCFSSTYATVKVPLKEINTELPDIKRNDYVFSDGIGKLTPDLAMKIAEKLQLASNPPCAYQIRFGGCKGVIACWPGNNDKFRLSLRPSMNKFVSNHRIIEIVSWTRFQPGFLNRQIITLLSALNVPDEIFSTMQDSMICKLDQMLENPDVALDIVTSSCEQETIAAIMLSAGRWLMGCLDELGVLEHGQCFIQVSTPSFESCVSKNGLGLSEAKRNVKLITGIVVVAKNPCLHPGDIRILEAVGAPGLHHLVDCLVFPQKGDRPHANEASGSDLDGDLYFVTWDEKLVPPSKRSWPPMDYSPAKVKKLQRPVNNSFEGKTLEALVLINQFVAYTLCPHQLGTWMSPRFAMYVQAIVRIAEIEASVGNKELIEFDGGNFTMNHHEESTEREAQWAIDVMSGGVDNTLGSLRSKSHNGVAILGRETHPIETPNHQEV
ncbi:hypothetical protein GIB67_036055 [Kingdonia uniflora]|uniref:RNA-dependent RNA polymerase n=1 Tax=Kingdonia uniflora TaxID=39325 RepID=A0A7J7NFJ6_9MAGN|nr:hypothetical protein GIB67_036055 [Kingdonia uniflora]